MKIRRVSCGEFSETPSGRPVLVEKRVEPETGPAADPEWLTCRPTAAQALNKIVDAGRSRTRLLAGLELLRRVSHQDDSKTAPTRLPTKREVDAAVRAFDRARRKVTQVIQPFKPLPWFLNPPHRETPEDPYGVNRPDVRQVKDYLSLVRQALERLQELVRRHGYRDAMKAYVVAHANRLTSRWFDAEVSELIDAASKDPGAKTTRKTYTTQTHKDWRLGHRALVHRMNDVVVGELGAEGYCIEFYQETPLSEKIPIGIEPPSDAELEKIPKKVVRRLD